MGAMLNVTLFLVAIRSILGKLGSRGGNSLLVDNLAWMTERVWSPHPSKLWPWSLKKENNSQKLHWETMNSIILKKLYNAVYQSKPD